MSSYSGELGDRLLSDGSYVAFTDKVHLEEGIRLMSPISTNVWALDKTTATAIALKLFLNALLTISLSETVQTVFRYVDFDFYPHCAIKDDFASENLSSAESAVKVAIKSLLETKYP